MGAIEGLCRETLSVARGGAAQEPRIRIHLEGCAPCRGAIVDLGRLAEAARTSLTPRAATSAWVESTLRRAQREPTSAWSPRFAVAVAAAAAVVALSVPLTYEVHQQPTRAASIQIELMKPVQDRVPYRVIRSTGTTTGNIRFASDTLAAIPANAIVVETF